MPNPRKKATLMGFLTSYVGTHRVNIPHPDPKADYWVDLKNYVSHGATEKSALALQEMEMVNGKPQPAPNIFKSQAELVLAAIDGWNLDDDNGFKWPLDMQHLRRLPDEVFTLLHKKVEELNKPRTPQEQAQFPAAGDGGDSESGDGGAAADPVAVPGGEGAVAATGVDA